MNILEVALLNIGIVCLISSILLSMQGHIDTLQNLVGEREEELLDIYFLHTDEEDG